MSERVAKVESLVLQTVAAALVEQLDRDAAMITVTRVDVSPDLRQAIIWLGLLGSRLEHERLLKAVAAHHRELQRAVAARMTTKFVPRLIFKPDGGGAYAAEIERLLQRLPD